MLKHRQKANPPPPDNAPEQDAAVAPPADAEDESGDIVWGAGPIGRIINRTPTQTYHLLKIGALKGAARKVGHRSICGSKRALRRLPLSNAE